MPSASSGPPCASGIEIYLDATVTEIGEEPQEMRQGRRAPGRSVIALSQSLGVIRFSARIVVLAMGCRERNRGNVAIAGTRPAGVLTAGLAQRLVNIEGCVPGKNVVIIGSGDIGLIMARRLTLVGCSVRGVVEIQDYPSGSARNIAQCLNDFSIPLHLGHVVTRIEGKDRVEAVRVAPLADGRPVPGREFRIPCDTVLLSVGLIPENELSRAAGVPINEGTAGPWVDADMMTGARGIFACGNVLHVHDLVDFVTEEARRCADRAAVFLRGGDTGTDDPGYTPGPTSVPSSPTPALPGRQNVFYLRPLVVKNDVRLEVRAGRAGDQQEEAGARAAFGNDPLHPGWREHTARRSPEHSRRGRNRGRGSPPMSVLHPPRHGVP